MERGRGYLKGRRIFFVYTHGIQDHDLDGVGAGMWGGGCRGWGGKRGRWVVGWGGVSAYSQSGLWRLFLPNLTGDEPKLSSYFWVGSLTQRIISCRHAYTLPQSRRSLYGTSVNTLSVGESVLRQHITSRRP